MSQITENTNRDISIDFIKMLAILGVIILHNDAVLYHSRYISTLARFALPLFLLVGGYNIFKSFSSKSALHLGASIKKLLLPYLFATIISCCIIQKEFNGAGILYALINFSATYPLYYVILYLELFICSVFITKTIKYGQTIIKTWKKILFFLLLCCSIYGICFLTTHYSIMFQWKFWSSMLLGGPMLLIWVLGMFFAAIDLHKKSKKSNVFLIILSCIGIGLFCIATFTGIIHQIPNVCGYTGNVFTILDIIYVCSIFTLIKGLGGLCPNNKNTVFHKFITYIGTRTYYIFLYHIVFQIITTQWITFPNIWIKRIIVFISMIIGPLVIEFVLTKLKMLVLGKEKK